MEVWTRLPCSVRCPFTLYHQTLNHCPSQAASQDREGNADHPAKKTSLCWAASWALTLFRGLWRNTQVAAVVPKDTGASARLLLLQQHHRPPGRTQWAHKGSPHPLAREPRPPPGADTYREGEVAIGELTENTNRLIRAFPFTCRVELLCPLS